MSPSTIFIISQAVSIISYLIIALSDYGNNFFSYKLSFDYILSYLILIFISYIFINGIQKIFLKYHQVKQISNTKFINFMFVNSFILSIIGLTSLIINRFQYIDFKNIINTAENIRENHWNIYQNPSINLDSFTSFIFVLALFCLYQNKVDKKFVTILIIIFSLIVDILKGGRGYFTFCSFFLFYIIFSKGINLKKLLIIPFLFVICIFFILLRSPEFNFYDAMMNIFARIGGQFISSSYIYDNIQIFGMSERYQYFHSLEFRIINTILKVSSMETFGGNLDHFWFPITRFGDPWNSTNNFGALIFSYSIYIGFLLYLTLNMFYAYLYVLIKNHNSDYFYYIIPVILSPVAFSMLTTGVFQYNVIFPYLILFIIYQFKIKCLKTS